MDKTDVIAASVDESQLGQIAVENEENIVLEDEQGYVLKEFHSDGYTAEFVYAETYSEESPKQLLFITDSDGKRQDIRMIYGAIMRQHTRFINIHHIHAIIMM